LVVSGVPGMSSTSKRREGSPFKLHLHRSISRCPMNVLAAGTIQQAAVMADPMYELAEAYRSGLVDRLLPCRPEDGRWFRFYRDHDLVTAGIEGQVGPMPDLIGKPLLGSMGLREGTAFWREVQAWSRTDPDGFKAAICGGRSRGELWRWVRARRRLGQRYYRHHLEALRYQIRDGVGEHDGGFDLALRGEPGLYYYMRVVLPAFLILRTTPVIELRRLRQRADEGQRLEAVERLCRMDPSAHRMPEVVDWMNVADGLVRQERERLVRKATDRGLGGGKFSRQAFKAMVAGWMVAFVGRVGGYLDFVNAGIQRAKLDPAVARELLHAVHRDRAGRGTLAASAYDSDIVEMQTGSWARQVERYAKRMEHLLITSGRLN